jgi:hypothetical protein
MICLQRLVVPQYLHNIMLVGRNDDWKEGGRERIVRLVSCMHARDAIIEAE